MQSTNDIYFAGYVMAKGNQLATTEKKTENGKTKTIFVFNIEIENFDKMKSDFFGGTGEVNAQQYMYALRSLKSLCFV